MYCAKSLKTDQICISQAGLFALAFSPVWRNAGLAQSVSRLAYRDIGLSAQPRNNGFEFWRGGRNMDLVIDDKALPRVIAAIERRNQLLRMWTKDMPRDYEEQLLCCGDGCYQERPAQLIVATPC